MCYYFFILKNNLKSFLDPSSPSSYSPFPFFKNSLKTFPLRCLPPFCRGYILTRLVDAWSCVSFPTL